MRRLGVLLITLSACKARISEGISDAPGADGTTTDTAAAADATQLGPWGAPTAIDITPVSDDDPTATGDLLELYFNRNADIYVSKRASVSEQWGAPTLVAELSSAAAETTPEVSYDGLTIYLASARAGGPGGYDIYVAKRASRTAAWGTPALVAELSSAAAEGAAAQTDPYVIAIDSDRGTMMLDIYIAKRTSPTAPFGIPVVVAELASAQNEGNPMLTTDLLTIYFDSNRSGDGELYAATRTSVTAAFGTPARIPQLSSASDESDPWISPDGRTLYFTSNRDGTLRLWQTTR